MNKTYHPNKALWLLLAMTFLLSGCALQLVSDYDEKSLESMERVAQKVNRFYLGLSYQSKEKRLFKASHSAYLNIEADLEALKNRQMIRPMNELTLKQVEITLKLWREDRLRHKTADSLSDFLIKRRKDQYQRLFLAMIKGEEAKQKVTADGKKI
ncbi:hypothetical protein [Thalassomonas actiniarum]|uniref:Lipoprotein n=1 Tax=Thalassomonas actiniarum TaxID=485447 RepID=A0AAE9YPG1_9GAMM|nr:hypothetical protein [Thalassomonas actiniarum]WDD98083.1 hypothetical protein SG35_022795 [Thalassomonas actiniarum]